MYQITAESIAQFREYLELAEKSPATVKKYIHVLEQLAIWLGEKTLDKKQLLEFRKKMAQQMSAGTINGYLSAINAYLAFAGRGELKVGFLKVQQHSFIEESRELTEKEYHRLVAAAERQGNQRLALVLMTLGGTGIRISELRFITAEAVTAGKAEIRMKGKNRTVLLEKKLCRRLAAYVKAERIDAGPVFRTRRGNPLDRSNLHHEMKKLCQEAHVDPQKVFPHNFRHLFARVFFSIEKNIAHLADVLGHSRIETTRIYIATTAAAHGRTLSRMNLVT